jgi:nucleoside phosphorylase
LPVAPTLVATSPALATRWASPQVLAFEAPESINLDSAQSWLAGMPEGSAFSETLKGFDIEVPQLNKLGLLASFTELVSRLPKLSFSETKRAIHIVAQFGQATMAAAPARSALFQRLRVLVRTASGEDLVGLRNLDAVALADLVPSLESALKEWVEALPLEIRWLPGHLSLLEYATATPKNWWSAPFVEWLSDQAKELNAARAPRIVGLFASQLLSEYLSKALPATKAVEGFIADGLPPHIASPQADHLLRLAEKRRWMRLHARLLLRSRPAEDAVMLHARIADKTTTGFVELRAAVGSEVLVKAACKTGERSLLHFVGQILAAADSDITPAMLSSCAHRAAVLREGLSVETPLLAFGLRDAVHEFLSDPGTNEADLLDVCRVCAERRAEMLLDSPDPAALFERLRDADSSQVIAALNVFVQHELLSGRPIKIATPDAWRAWIDSAAVTKGLAKVDVRDRAVFGVNAFRCLPFLTDDHCREWLVDLFTHTQYRHLSERDATGIAELLESGHYPNAAKVVRDTVEQFHRRDVAPIHERIRYTYQMARAYPRAATASGESRLPKVLIATALPLEREAVMRHLSAASYDPDLFADVAPWPADNPLFEVYVFTTGAGNLSALAAMLRAVSKGVAPTLAFFTGVCGAVKDSAIGDVVYGTKVYYYEGGKEEAGMVHARPNALLTEEALVQMAIRVADKAWQPETGADGVMPRATPAVIGSGELVLASTADGAANYKLIKSAYNDTQVVDMEAYGFMKAMDQADVKLAMVIRGVSDQIAGKGTADARGSQPLAMRNAAAFLFALIRDCQPLLPKKPRRNRGLFSFFFPSDDEE